MPVPVPPTTFANHYTLTITETNPTTGKSWSNSQDLVYADGVLPDPADAPVQAFITTLRGLLRGDAYITKATCRLWTRGDQPLASQAALWEDILNIQGTAFAAPAGAFSGGDHNPTIGEIVAEIVKPVFGGGGKPGRLYLRNLYRDVDIVATAGGPPTFSGIVPGADPTHMNTWLDTNMSPYCEDNPLPRFCLVHWSRLHPLEAPFDSAMKAPVFQRIGTHDLSHKSTR